MKSYRVMKPGHKIGHHVLELGAYITAAQFNLTDADLEVYVRRGVLRDLSKGGN